MKVAVLCGGRSYERAVSLRSGAQVADALTHSGHEPILMDTDANTAIRLADLGIDCAFIALHGRGGEDGSIQELLELLHIPYTGSRPRAAAMSNDKSIAKRILRKAGIVTPESVSLTATALQDYGAAEVLHTIPERVGLPMVVKPASGGSALGIRFVDEMRALPAALVSALSYDQHVLVERYVAGREIAIAVLGTDTPRALPAVRISPRNADYYDFASRYTHGETEFSCPPADLTKAELADANTAALAAYRILGLRGFGRVDLIVDDAGTPWILELNAIPGLTETSLVPLAANAAGISMAQLVDELLADALR